MKLFRKVAIIGTGLIGGSLALAIRKKHLAAQVGGVGRHRQTIRQAKAKGAIDEGSLSLGIIRDADLVVLATPVNAILSLAPAVAKIIPRGCVVTDVGSTKLQICRRLEKIFPHFVGSHPLAGSERGGIRNCDAGIFAGSLCLLTPAAHASPRALRKLRLLWSRLGAKTVLLSAAEHDRILSFTSHLPHALAFSLVSSVPSRFLKFSSGSLKSTTRITSSDAGLWSDIFLTNREELLKAIGIFEARLSSLKSAVSRKDAPALKRFLRQARKKKTQMITD